MKRIDRYIFKEHLVPFILSLLVLLFILLANFMLKKIDQFLGKGLGLDVLVEYLFYNMAWILALAVPMAVLISTLTAFGRFSADNEITAMRATGISTAKLLRAPLLFGVIITCLMIYFNNQILPEMNHKARMLTSDISRKRPDLDFEVGYFIETIPEYTFLLGNRDGKVFEDIQRHLKYLKKQGFLISLRGADRFANSQINFLVSLGSIISSAKKLSVLIAKTIKE